MNPANVPAMLANAGQPAGEFAPYPSSWYYLGSREEIMRRPLRFDLPGGKSFVAYGSASGKIAVLDRKCSHMGADLSLGCVVGDRLQCPLHGWEYGADGRCEHIPATKDIPAFARQQSYPVSEAGGQVFFFNAPQARFALPFFDGVEPQQLLPARAFNVTAEAPWHIFSANGFDVQHFHVAHDRTMVGTPTLSRPAEHAWRMATRFKVSGKSVYDRLTRVFSGEELTMTVTNWCGNLAFVTAEFPRTTSYGMVSFIPLGPCQTQARVIVWVKRRPGVAGALLDPFDTWIRRWFIREFVLPDVKRSAGIGFNAHRIIAADKPLADFTSWLLKIHR